MKGGAGECSIFCLHDNYVDRAAKSGGVNRIPRCGDRIEGVSNVLHIGEEYGDVKTDEKREGSVGSNYCGNAYGRRNLRDMVGCRKRIKEKVESRKGVGWYDSVLELELALLLLSLGDGTVDEVSGLLSPMPA